MKLRRSQPQSEAYPAQEVKGYGIEDLLTSKIEDLETPEARQEALDHLAGLFDGFLEEGEKKTSAVDPDKDILRVSGLLLSNRTDKGFRRYVGTLNISATHSPEEDTREYRVVAGDTEMEMTARDGVVEKAEVKEKLEWEEPSAFEVGALQRKYFSGKVNSLHPIDHDKETTVRSSRDSDWLKIVPNTRLRKIGRGLRGL
jgi:nitroimidazol reductase NimA-like FMN-containing flavoprotein (pyridoxamine 5'-phosphate oxidase superfamily)